MIPRVAVQVLPSSEGVDPATAPNSCRAASPTRSITGLDTSEAMLDHARTRAPERGSSAEHRRLGAYGAAGPDFRQWRVGLPLRPPRALPRLAATLAPGGVLAVQMPSTARESSHALMRMVAAEGPWSSRLVPVAKTQPRCEPKTMARKVKPAPPTPGGAAAPGSRAPFAIS